MNPNFKNQKIPLTGELAPNTTADFKNFHISYNARSADYGNPTTALVIAGAVFLILNNDHRDELHTAAIKNGLEGCMVYFIANVNKANRMSEHREAAGIGADRFGLAKITAKHLQPETIAALKAAIENANG